MDGYSFPQADNLELIYQIFIEFPNEGLNRYSFGEKYHMADRQGAYYLNALCFIGLADKKGKNTFLSSKGQIIRQFDEPFRRKVFQLAILDNKFICDTYHKCKGIDKSAQKETVEILIEGTYGIESDAMLSRRARTLLSWYKWFEKQEYIIEEKYNE